MLNGKKLEDVAAALQKGDLKFTLHGKKLHGSWVLVRTRGFGSKPDKSWLLIKHRDKFASTEDITVSQPRSVLSKRLLADIARENGGDVDKAATGDPVKVSKRNSPKTTKTPTRKKRAKS